MADLLYSVSYIFRKYPDKEALSEPRLQQMLYLADWKFAIEHDARLTNIKWKIKDGKPYAGKDLLPYRLSLMNGFRELFRSVLALLGLKPKKKGLIKEKKKILDLVIETSVSKSLDEIIELVCSTYPILGEEEVEKIDLVDMAKKYKVKARPFLTKRFLGNAN